MNLDGDGDATTTDDLATLSAGLQDSDGDGRHYFDAGLVTFADDLQVVVNGAAGIDLPVFFPTQHQPLTPNLTVTIPDLGEFVTDASNSVQVTTPDFDVQFGLLDLLNNLGVIVDGLDGMLAGIQDALDGEVLGVKLPLVGDKLADGAQVIADLRRDVIARLQPLANSPNKALTAVQNALANAFIGAGVLGDTDNSGTVTAADVVIRQQGSDRVEFDVLLERTATLEDSNVGFDIGVQALGLEVDSSVQLGAGFQFRIGFGVDINEGFYVKTDSAQPELTVEVAAALPDLEATGRLGPLRLIARDEDADDDPNNNFDSNGDRIDLDGDGQRSSQLAASFSVDLMDPSGDGRLQFEEIVLTNDFGSLVEASFDASADVHLDLRVDFDSAQFPAIETEFEFLWDVSGNTSDGIDLLANAPYVAFNNVALDLGSFFSDFARPVLRGVQDFMEPFQPVIDVATRPLPGISELPEFVTQVSNQDGEPGISLLDLAFHNEAEASNQPGYRPPNSNLVSDLTKLALLIDRVPTADGENLILPIGSFDLVGVDLGGESLESAVENVLTTFGPVGDQINGIVGSVLADEAADFMQELNAADAESFSFPILEDPASIFGALIGRQVDLFTFEPQPLTFDFPLDVSFGPPFLNLHLFGGVSGKLDIAMGYDTEGIRRLVESGFESPEDLLMGFYIADTDDGTAGGRDVPEALIHASINATGRLGVPGFSVEAGGGVLGRLDANFRDNDNDGRVRIDELVQNSPTCLADIDGEITASLFAKAEAFFTTVYEVDFAEETLASFNYTCSPPPVPVLAQKAGSTLRLNMGPRAHLRINGDVDGDAAEAFELLPAFDEAGDVIPDRIRVRAFGATQTFFDVDHVVAEAGGGNDKISVDPLLAVTVDLSGGDGNDRLQAGSAGGTVDGGEGDDVLRGSASHDVLRGGGGNDRIYGEAGNDSIDAGPGDDRVIAGEGDDDIVGGTGDDDLSGQAGNDVIRGGDGDDEINGGEGDNSLFGDAGDDLIQAESGTDVIYGGAGNDAIRSGEGDDLIVAGAGDDIIDSGEGDDHVNAGHGQDVISDTQGDNTLRGGSGDDEITAGPGDDWIVGGRGNDRIDAGEGDNLVIGGSEQATDLSERDDDEITTGDGRDIVAGDDAVRVGDTLSPTIGSGNDILLTAGGDDVVFAGGGDDVVETSTGNDTVDGGSGDDQIRTHTGNDFVTAGEGDDDVSTAEGDDQIIGGGGADRIQAGDGDDTVDAGDGDDLVFGGAGADLIDAGSGDDRVVAGTGSDNVVGGAGDDIVFGNSGNDFIDANGGDDQVEAGDGNDTVHAGEGDDQVRGGTGIDTIDLGDGDDWADGGDANDVIGGGDGHDVIQGGLGQDSLTGGPGNDRIDGGEGIDLIEGGDGNDRLIAGLGIGDVIRGGDGDDSITGSNQGSEVDADFSDAIRFGDSIEGGSGDDVIHGLGGADQILGGPGNDTIHAGNGSDLTLGGPGDDRIDVGDGDGDEAHGGDGNDVLLGSDGGNDRLFGDAGRDRIEAFDGDDIVVGGSEDDYLDGGAGVDQVTGGAGRDVLIGGGGDGDQLTGGPGDDVIRGSDDGADTIDGGEGNDWLLGHGGNDVIHGGNGDDRIEGLAGDDTLFGGPGRDILVGGADHDRLDGHDADTADDNAIDHLYGDDAEASSMAAGGDQLFGRGGNDRLFGGPGDDFIDAGSGNDDRVDFGAGESANPNDLVPPNPTAPPTPGVSIPKPVEAATLPVETQPAPRGEWSGFAGGLSPNGLLEPQYLIGQPALATRDGVTIMAWSDVRSGTPEIYVAMFDGALWHELDGSATHGGVSSSESASIDPTVSVDNTGAPIVAWIERSNTQDELHIRQWTGGWVPVTNDPANNTGPFATSSRIEGPVLDFSGSQISLAFNDKGSAPNGEIKVWTLGTTGTFLGAVPTTGSQLDLEDVTIDAFETTIGVAWSAVVNGRRQVFAAINQNNRWSVLSIDPDNGISDTVGESRRPTIQVVDDGSAEVAWQTAREGRWVVSYATLTTAGATELVRDVLSDAGVESTAQLTLPQLSRRASVTELLFASSETHSTSSIGALRRTTQGWVEATPGTAAGIHHTPHGIDTLRVAGDGDQLIAYWTERDGVDRHLRARLQNAPPQGRTFLADTASSVQSILDSETLTSDDRIVITESVLEDITIRSADSGVTLLAQPGVILTGTIRIEADDVTLQRLSINGTIDLVSGANIQLLDSQITGTVVANAASGLLIDANHLSNPNGVALAISGPAIGVVRNNRIHGSDVGFHVSASSTIRFAQNTVDDNLLGITIDADQSGPFTENVIRNNETGVQQSANAAWTNNTLRDNEVGLWLNESDTPIVFGQAGINQIRNNNLGVRLTGGQLVNQTLQGNLIATAGTGTVGGLTAELGNRIVGNDVGPTNSGLIAGNRILNNRIGLSPGDDAIVSGNTIARNLEHALEVHASSRVRIVSNTVQHDSGTAIQLAAGASEIELRGNLVQSDAGVHLQVQDDSQLGFFSDFNFYSSGDPSLPIIEFSKSFDDLLAWQVESRHFDQHSIGLTQIDPTLHRPRFVGAGDNNFSLAPPITGLEAASPGIDSSDPRMTLGSASTRVNLLTNPSFESGTTGWTVNTPATAVAPTPLRAFDGNSVFSGGDVPAGFAEQLVDLTQFTTEAALDAGSQLIAFSGRLRSLAESLNDRGRLTLTIRDESDSVIESRTVFGQATDDRWELLGDVIRLPAGSRTVAYRFDADRNSSNDLDAYLDSAAVYLLGDNELPEIGADGFQATEVAAESSIRLISPDLYFDAVRSRESEIRWQTTGNTSRALVHIDLFQDSLHGPQFLQNLAVTDDDGSFLWIPENVGIAAGTQGLRIGVSLGGDSATADLAAESFTVPELVSNYYVNDGSLANDTLTTGVGDHRNTGTHPGSPKPLPIAILDRYTIGPGSTILVDAGDYVSLYETAAGDVDSRDDEGFTLRGVANDSAVLRLANPLLDQSVIGLHDADSITLENLTLRGGTHGLYATDASTDMSAIGLRVEGTASHGIRINNDSDGSRILDGSIVAAGGAGIWSDALVAEIDNNTISGFITSGIYLEESGPTRITRNVVSAGGMNTSGEAGIYVDNVGFNDAVEVGSLDLTAKRGNRVFDIGGDGIFVRGESIIAGNSITGHTGVGAVGIVAEGLIQNNVVADGNRGIEARGNVVANRIENHRDLALLTNGSVTVSRNVIDGAETGIRTLFGPLATMRIENNLITDTMQTGLLISHDSVEVANNTFVSQHGNAVRTQLASDLLFENNIFSMSTGLAFDLDSDATIDLQSDFNLFSNDTVPGFAGGEQRDTLSDWQTAINDDASSLSATAQFVDPSNGDFHLVSPNGSFHGGSLAPILDGDGLPIRNDGSLTVDTDLSVGVDGGNPSSEFASEPSPRGNAINLGAFGGTEQASVSPSDYVSVFAPELADSIAAGRSTLIRWRTHNSDPVLIELVQGANATTIDTMAAGIGQYVWNVDPGIIPNNDYQVRVTNGTSVGISETFSITPPVSVFYVNDNAVELGDWTTEVGDDSNDGLTPQTPKASIASVLATYDLQPGDLIRVDNGTYTLATNIVIDSQDSGVSIVGFAEPNQPTKSTLIDRNSTAAGTSVFSINGADDVTLQSLRLTGAQTGISIPRNSNADRFSLVDSEVFDNGQYGIRVLDGNTDTTIRGSTISGHGPTGASFGIQILGADATIRDSRFVANSIGIEIGGARSLVDNNRFADHQTAIRTTGVRSNEIDWIQIHNNVIDTIASEGIRFQSSLVTGNRISGDSMSGSISTGLSGTSGRAVENTISNLETGMIAGGGTFIDNTVHDTTVSGIRVTNTGTQVVGNQISNSPIGIDHFGSSNQTVTIANNQIVASDTAGVRLRGGIPIILNNTIVQETGIAVAMEDVDAELRNNIFHVRNGVVFQFDADETGVLLESDYNVFDLISSGQLAIANGVYYNDLSAWSFDFDLDRGSVSGDAGLTDPTSDLRLTTGSIAIDAGDPDSSFVNEPTPNGNRINAGAFGGTVSATNSAIRTIDVLSPANADKLVTGNVSQIELLTSGLPADATLSLDLSIDSGQTWATIATSIPVDASGRASTNWIPTSETAANSAVVKATWQSGTDSVDATSGLFSIQAPTSEYFVNDADTTGDTYTASAGDNLNSGTDADRPMASLSALINAYRSVLKAGDVIYIDSGTYTVPKNVALDESLSGITIRGTGPDLTHLTRNNVDFGSYVFEFTGADDVTIESLSISTAETAVYANTGADSDRISVRDVHVLNNRLAGLHLETSNDQALIVDSTFDGTPGGSQDDNQRIGIDIDANDYRLDSVTVRGSQTGAQLFGTGIVVENSRFQQNTSTGVFVQASDVLVENNIFDANTSVGLRANSTNGADLLNILVRENTVINQRSATSSLATGLLLSNVTAVNNTLDNNDRGLLLTRSVASGNHLVGNTTAIETQGASGNRIEANRLLRNDTGIRLSTLSNFASNVDSVRENVISQSIVAGIVIDRVKNSQIIGNTIQI
ncbi:MAG: right-handed parallel beta-helix repeat-containing protein, partial [Planctomycetota bacterium]